MCRLGEENNECWKNVTSGPVAHSLLPYCAGVIAAVVVVLGIGTLRL